MKLFVLVSRFPYPLEKGDKLRAYYQLKEFHKTHQVHLCCITHKRPSEDDIKMVKEICSELSIVHIPRFIAYFNVLFQFFTGKPFQVGYFKNFWSLRVVKQQILNFQPDHIYCQLIRTAAYVKEMHQYAKTIDYMDALGQGMMRRAKISRGIRSWAFREEGRRLLHYENRVFDYFNHQTIISEQDKNLISHPNNKDIHVIENGISEKFFEINQNISKKYELVFVGNLNYPPNITCASFIITDILPLLNSEYPTLKLLLAGATPHPSLVKLAEHPNVELTGWVNDIRESYQSGQIFIAPLFIGTGLQNKLLEAMAQEIPVITTELANNALKALDGKEILIGKTAEDFYKHITALLRQPEKRKMLGLAGKNYVSQNFSWPKSVDKINAIIQPK